MPVQFNMDESVPFDASVIRRVLLAPERIRNDCTALDRSAMYTGSRLAPEVEGTARARIQPLPGSVVRNGSKHRHRVDAVHWPFLPNPVPIRPRRRAPRLSMEPWRMPHASTPQSSRRGLNLCESTDGSSPGSNRSTMPDTASTRLLRSISAMGQMTVYPPGTRASNDHREVAQHFQCIISGTFLRGALPHPVRAGDTLYNHKHERQDICNDGDSNPVCVEYLAPAAFLGVRVNAEPVRAWRLTGGNIGGGAAHSTCTVVRTVPFRQSVPPESHSPWS